MGKKKLLASAAAVVLVLGGAGLVGATMFPAASQDVMDYAPIDVPDEAEEKSSTAKGADGGDDGEKKLKRADGGENCDEITQPVPHEKVPPVYPESARKEKVMGMVILETVVTDKGEVAEARILESPDDRLSQAAMDSVLQWTFDPALCDSRPVAVYYNLTINFRLK